MDEKIWSCRKETSDITSLARRKVSIYISYVFIKLGFSAESVCVGWGIIHVLNSFLLYKSISGVLYLIPVFLVISIFADILDVVDGEIARYRNTINPITGKLLDGIGHRMTEYSMLIAFSYGIYERTNWHSSLIIGFIAIFGEAMFTYCNERRILVIRLYAKKEVHKKMSAKVKRVPVDSSFFDFTFPQKIEFIRGLFIYRSVYIVLFFSIISAKILFVSFVVLAFYKNFSWVKMMYALVKNPPELQQGAVGKAAYWKKPPSDKNNDANAK